MFSCHARELLATEHSCDFRNPVVSGDLGNRGSRPPAGHGLRDDEVPVRADRALRQMGYRHHLVRLRDAAHLLPYRAADFSADVRVDLVEDEGRRLVVRRENRLQGEHYARGLARARDRGERPRRLAGVRLEHVYDRVAAVRRRLRGGKVHAELRLQEAEVAQLLRHRLREFRGGGAAAARHLGALGAQRLFRRGEARPERAEPVVAVFERVERRALLGESRRGVSVLAAHAVHH